MMKKSSDYFWLWMPIVFCLLLSSGYFIVNALTDSHKDNPGAVIYALLFVVFYGLIAAPVMSILYCKKIRNVGWRKYLCCLYNAVVTGMYFTICMFPQDFRGVVYSVLSIPSLVVFLSGLLCGGVTLMVFDLRKSKNRVS